MLGAAIAGVLLTLVAGCRSAPKPPVHDASSGPVPGPYAQPESDAVPAWLGEPLSWEKLARIEAWLENEGRHATQHWRNQAELDLNSGRLEFARREIERGPEPAKSTGKPASTATAKLPADVAARLRTAKAAFDRLLLRDDLNAGQRTRADKGSERAAALLARASSAPKTGGTPVVARAAWGAQKARPALMDRTVGGYSRITVHHSADNDPVVLDGSPARSFEAMRDIQRAHMNGKETHYGDIGYHFVIDPYGRVLEGRDLAYQGAHAKGDNNVRNIGICLIGNFDQEKPTEAALTALRRLLDDMRSRYAIPRNLVYGHGDLRSTRCPGANLDRWVTAYRGGPPATVTAQAAAPRRPQRSGR